MTNLVDLVSSRVKAQILRLLFGLRQPEVHLRELVRQSGLSLGTGQQELRRLTVEYQDRTLTDFLETVALITDQDTLSEGKNAPTLLTLHAAAPTP